MIVILHNAGAESIIIVSGIRLNSESELISYKLEKLGVKLGMFP